MTRGAGAGRAGVPLEVMGLMLGDFVDEYTVRVVDVFAMPQSGTGVSVEAVDPVFQMHMLEMLKQTGRPEMVVGWCAPSACPTEPDPAACRRFCIPGRLTVAGIRAALGVACAVLHVLCRAI